MIKKNNTIQREDLQALPGMRRVLIHQSDYIRHIVRQYEKKHGAIKPISTPMKAKVDKDVKEAGRLGVTGTPGFFINGRHMSGAKPFSEFKVVIDEEIKKEG